jgi:hypothetical protein
MTLAPVFVIADPARTEKFHAVPKSGCPYAETGAIVNSSVPIRTRNATERLENEMCLDMMGYFLNIWTQKKGGAKGTYLSAYYNKIFASLKRYR